MVINLGENLRVDVNFVAETFMLLTTWWKLFGNACQRFYFTRSTIILCHSLFVEEAL
jgi:hypothetical protein